MNVRHLPNHFLCAGLLGAMLMVSACKDEVKKKPETPPVPVVTAPAVERDIPVTLKVVGRAEAFETVSLRSRIDGQVASVLFTEGQRVKQGDVLIRLDPSDLEARLKQAEATAARDEALIAKSRADTARYSALKERNFVSEEKVNDIRTNEASATANLRATRAAAEYARLQLAYTTIRAPITGTIGARLVFPGSAVKTNDTLLAVVNRIQPILVSFPVPERHLPLIRASIRAGEAMGKRMQVDVTQPGRESRHFAGEVRFVDNAVDTTTGTILMKAELPNGDESLTPGQFLNISLILETLKAAVAVPNEAIQQGADGNFVFIVKEDKTVDLRKIQVSASDGTMTAITDGLKPGETVIIDGHLRLTPGARVRPKEPGNEGKTGDKKAEKTETAPADKAK